MLFGLIKHGGFISVQTFHILPPATPKEKSKQTQPHQHSNNPKGSKIRLVLKVWEGLVGWGQGDMEEKMLP